MSAPEQPRVDVPQMCRTHQSLLVHQAGIPESGPWRAVIIMANIALFQAATADPSTYDRLGGDLTRIKELGCLACYKPDARSAKSSKPRRVQTKARSKPSVNAGSLNTGRTFDADSPE